jgi:hypothetical protein
MKIHENLFSSHWTVSRQDRETENNEADRFVRSTTGVIGNVSPPPDRVIKACTWNRRRREIGLTLHKYVTTAPAVSILEDYCCQKKKDRFDWTLNIYKWQRGSLRRLLCILFVARMQNQDGVTKSDVLKSTVSSLYTLIKQIHIWRSYKGVISRKLRIFSGYKHTTATFRRPTQCTVLSESSCALSSSICGAGGNLAYRTPI